MLPYVLGKNKKQVADFFYYPTVLAKPDTF
jgi:hypothetical protein